MVVTMEGTRANKTRMQQTLVAWNEQIYLLYTEFFELGTRAVCRRHTHEKRG